MVNNLSLLVYLSFGFLISVSDVRSRLIRNRHLIAFLVSGLLLHLSIFSFSNLKSCFFVILICSILHLLFGGRIGAGDLKLFWVLSFWTIDFTEWLEGITIVWLLGGLFAIIYLGFHWRNKPTELSIPFAPFIFLGFLPFV
ncbi:unannotated protein [freshwater metagenome]|uniref:Unannotated protein n=1 Tax=freshwater metagenome TaxID=449393 RepID=A0A6J7KDJ3_9ZZZZ